MGLKRIAKEFFLEGNLFVPKRLIDDFFYYVLPVTLGVLLLYPEAVRKLQAPLGVAAITMLIIVLFVKPPAVLFPKIRIFSKLVSMRRELGLATFFLALFHFLYYVAIRGMTLHTTFWEALVRPGAIRYGAWALLLLLVISASSIWFIISRLKRWWKRIQRLSYLVLPLVLIHSTLMERESWWQAIVIFSLYVILKGIEWYVYLRRKRRREMSAEPERPKTEATATEEPS